MQIGGDSACTVRSGNHTREVQHRALPVWCHRHGRDSTGVTFEGAQPSHPLASSHTFSVWSSDVKMAHCPSGLTATAVT